MAGKSAIWGAELCLIRRLYSWSRSANNNNANNSYNLNPAGDNYNNNNVNNTQAVRPALHPQLYAKNTIKCVKQINCNVQFFQNTAYLRTVVQSEEVDEGARVPS